MPDIFRAMIGDSDVHLINELHAHLVLMFAKENRRPLHSTVLWTYLSARAPSTKITFIIQSMEKSGMIARVPGTEELWVPKAAKRLVE